MKKKIILLFVIIAMAIIYFNIINPYRQEHKIKTELKNKWNIDIEIIDRLRITERNRPQWHGEHQKFISFDISNLDRISNYIRDNNLYSSKINFDLKKKIIEIEDILNIEDKDRVDFKSDYYYTMRVKYNPSFGSEKKNDILYIILTKGEHSAKLIFIEDLNILDLERSF